MKINMEQINRLRELLKEKPRTFMELKEIFGFKKNSEMNQLIFTATGHMLIYEEQHGKGRNGCTVYALMDK